MGKIVTDRSVFDPIWVTNDDCRYLIDPFDRAAEIAGTIAEGRAAEAKLSRAKQILARRDAEVVEMMRDWENVEFDDGVPAEFSEDNARALLVSVRKLTMTLYVAAYERQQTVEREKKASNASLNGTGGASTEKAEESSAEDATTPENGAPQNEGISANT